VTPLLEITGLSIEIAARPLCRNLDLTIEPGQCWALLGRNGAGKSTLLHNITGLTTDHDGAIVLQGKPLATLSPRQRARRIGLLLQHSSRGFGGNVFDTVMSGRHPYLGPLQREGEADHLSVQRALRDLGLETLAMRTLDNLSGGELRRVELARLLAQQAPLSLLDEPLNHLDPAHQAHCLTTVVHRCVGAQRAALIVAHDLNLAYQACDHWLLLEPGGGWQSGSRAEMADADRLSRVFGHRIDRLVHDGRVTFFTRFIEPQMAATGDN
jgi:iron complex transport system ATP-binding protein